MARVAAVLAEYYGDEIRDLRAQGLDEETVAWTIVDDFDGDELAALLVYVDAAPTAGRGVAAPEPRRGARPRGRDRASPIWPATRRSARSSTRIELAAFVGRWEALVYDTVAQHGGRVVKTIGDEVMFAGLSAQVARIAIALRDAAGEHELPPVRVGHRRRNGRSHATATSTDRS